MLWRKATWKKNELEHCTISASSTIMLLRDDRQLSVAMENLVVVVIMNIPLQFVQGRLFKWASSSPLFCSPTWRSRCRSPRGSRTWGWPHGPGPSGARTPAGWTVAPRDVASASWSHWSSPSPSCTHIFLEPLAHVVSHLSKSVWNRGMWKNTEIGWVCSSITKERKKHRKYSGRDVNLERRIRNTRNTKHVNDNRSLCVCKW